MKSETGDFTLFVEDFTLQNHVVDFTLFVVDFTLSCFTLFVVENTLFERSRKYLV